MKVTQPMIERGARALAEAVGIEGPDSVPHGIDFEEAAEAVLRGALGDIKPKLTAIEGQMSVDDFPEAFEDHWTTKLQKATGAD